MTADTTASPSGADPFSPLTPHLLIRPHAWTDEPRAGLSRTMRWAGVTWDIRCPSPNIA